MGATLGIEAACRVLRMDDLTHRAFLGDRELVRVTTALELAGVIQGVDFFTDESRRRGSYLHEAVQLFHEDDLAEDALDGTLRPFWDGYRRFLAESGFRPLHIEGAVYDEAEGYAGRFDLLGSFPELSDQAVDLIDIKTGATPRWVRIQTQLYRRRIDRPRVRRWALELPGTGDFRLRSLNLVKGDRAHRIDRAADAYDESVGLAAVRVANYIRAQR